MTQQDTDEVIARGERMAKALHRLQLPADDLTASAVIMVMAGVLQDLHVRRAWVHATLDRALNDLGVPK